MKKVFLFLCLLCVIALNCKKKEDPAPIPTPIDTTIRLNAEFTYQDSVHSPVPITFTNTTKDIPASASTEWEIDGVITDRSKVSITQQLAVGKHTVTLRIYISFQIPNTFVVTKTITVLPAYTRVGIKGVTILNFPSQDNGRDWDLPSEGRYPDVYFDIVSSTTFSLIYKPDLATRKEDLQLANLPTGWYGVNNKPLFIQNDLYQKITLSLYDYDGPTTTPRFMSNIQNIYFKDANFGFNIFYPPSIKVTDNKDMLMQLNLEWLD